MTPMEAALARRRPPVVHGLVVVDKPAGLTSHDVVAMLRRRLGERRVGHAGTLDPDATGVLLVGVGQLTRALRFLTALPKTYTGEVVFGVETTTLDASGEVTARHDMPGLTRDTVRSAAADHLTGSILQVPPMVSALRVEGRRLHELAREGVEVDREPRPVTVHRFDADATDDPLVYRITVQCSSGTYIRSLAADLGHLLGGGAHLRALRRTAIGSFTVSDAAPPDEADLLPPADALRDYERVVIDDATAALVRHGRVFPEPVGPGEGPWAVLDRAGVLLAVYERHGAGAKPAVVLAGA
jgi:tRNA pseudouridine55 synthase